MNDSLFLPPRQGAGGWRPLGGWECLWTPLGEGEAEGVPQGRGRGWQHVEVPAQLGATEGRSSVWYRTSFARPDHTGRVLLRFGGAFLAANVWLNGRLLGSHYGYFAPFAFDITPHLQEQNLLVVCCESPVEADAATKRHLMGWFNDSDSRPNPAGGWLRLPPPYRYEMPLGLWRPVELEFAENVVLESLRIDARPEADVGRVQLEARLRNLDGREMRGEVTVEVAGPGAAAPLRIRREYRVAGGGEEAVTLLLSVPGARRWSPWRLGEPVLYDARVGVTVGSRESVRIGDRFGFRAVDARAGLDSWHVRVNGRPLFLRGACYLPGFRLDQLTEDRFRTDLELARSANLDALRVHAHVLPEEFYREADAAGMLVLAELPLTRAYAYHAGADEARFFERAVRAQAQEMVEMLRNRPSVMAWTAHDDPPWVPASADLADVHAVRQNYTIDQEVRAAFEDADPSRLALAASGEFDEHVWAGWRGAGWEALREVEPQMVTEYGAQALPAEGSDAWDALGRRWPVADDEPAWLAAGLEAPAWSDHGAGLPSEHASLEELTELSQDYQAFLVSYATEQFRARKFERCWGAFVYHLVDPAPGIGFGMLDAARRPRPAFEALAEAMAPVRVVIDPTGFRPLVPFGFAYDAGAKVGIRLIVVNDDPALTGGGRLRWTIARERAPEQSSAERLLDHVRRKSFSGEVAVALPTAFEPALHATTISVPIDAEGDYRIEAELFVQGRVVAASGLDFTVGGRAPAVRERPRIPPRLAALLADPPEFRLGDNELTFCLINRARPAVLTRLADLRLDGVLVTGARVMVEAASGRMALPRRLELPVDREVAFHVELERMPGTECSVLELDVAIPGVASGRLRLDRSA